MSSAHSSPDFDIMNLKVVESSWCPLEKWQELVVALAIVFIVQEDPLIRG